MTYLIIPIACFVLLAGLGWLWFYASAKRMYWKGTVDELDRVLPNLMTANLAESCLVMRVPGRLPSLKMTFPRSLVRLEIPLVTELQRDRRDNYLEILQGVNLNARISSDSSDHETLVCEVKGPSPSALPVIKDVFAKLFETDSSKLLDLQVFGRFSDRKDIDKAVHEYRLKIFSEESSAATEKRKPKSFEEGRAGCMGTLANLWLLPIPFVIAYLEYGFIAASGVLATTFVLKDIYFRWKKRRTSFNVVDALKIVVLVLTGTTIFVEDPPYLQLIPTVGLTSAAFAHALAVTFNLKWPSLMDNAKNEDPSVRKAMTCAIIATCVGSAAMSEYLRAVLSLDDWIWYFAFVRIELVFGILITAIPSGIYFMRDKRSNDNDGGNAT